MADALASTHPTSAASHAQPLADSRQNFRTRLRATDRRPVAPAILGGCGQGRGVHRRGRARAARQQRRPGDLPGHRAHAPRSPSSTSSSTTWRSADGIMRALRAAADDARALAQGRAPGHRALDPRGSRRRRRLLPEADPTRRARLRRDRADRVPVGPHTPTRSARPRSRSSAWARRWARSRSIRGRCAATTSTTPTSCASTSIRSRAPTSPTRCASPPRRARCSTSSATPASRRPRAAAASTSTSGSSRAGRSPTCATPRSRSAASSSGGCPARSRRKWWKEERGERIFVDYNQNARDRTIASAYSIRPKPGAPVSAPLTWDELAASQPEDFTVATMPARFAERRRPARRDRRRRPLAAAAARPVRARRTRAERHAVSARLSEDARRAEARPAVTRPRSPARLTALRRACGSFFAPRRVTGADGGGTTGPMSPSGASSRSTITGAWSLGPLPLRAWRSTQAARTRPGDRRRRRARGRSASRRSWWNIPAR